MFGLLIANTLIKYVTPIICRSTYFLANELMLHSTFQTIHLCSKPATASIHRPDADLTDEEENGALQVFRQWHNPNSGLNKYDQVWV